MASFLLNRHGPEPRSCSVLVSVIGFAVLHLAPGGPLAQFALVPGMTQAELAAHRPRRWGSTGRCRCNTGNGSAACSTGDWGRSYRDSQPVLADHRRTPARDLELMVTARSLIAVLTRHLGRRARRRAALLGVRLRSRRSAPWSALSIPTFWFGLVVIYIFSVKLGWLPAGNRSTVGRRLAARLRPTT